jgi:uncharacterized protein (UPF0548 family)
MRSLRTRYPTTSRGAAQDLRGNRHTLVESDPRIPHRSVAAASCCHLVISKYSDSVVGSSSQGNLVFLFSKPGQDAIRSFLAAQKDKHFSYADVGASRIHAPRDYVVDHNRVQLGHGAAVYERAVHALKQWKMFQMPWVDLYWPNTPIEAGATVAIVISHLGFWSLNACRVVYLIQERDVCEKFGFAYGTLPEHGELGEERFTVEFHPDDQSVWYDLYAFSRPRRLARLAYPYTRNLQRRFARDSKAAMQMAAGG